MRNTLVETLIGAAVLAVAAGFLWFAYTVADVRSPGGYGLTARFNRADGIATGTDVRLAGVKVGNVASVTLDEATYEAVVRMQIDSAVKLPDDSFAKIALDGLLGDSFINLEPGGSETMLNAGEEVLLTSGSVDLLSLISTAIFSTSGSDKSEGKDGSTDE